MYFADSEISSSAQSTAQKSPEDLGNSELANMMKEKTPMCLVNELARYNKVFWNTFKVNTNVEMDRSGCYSQVLQEFSAILAIPLWIKIAQHFHTYRISCTSHIWKWLVKICYFKLHKNQWTNKNSYIYVKCVVDVFACSNIVMPSWT